MSAITAKASRKMKKYAVLTREPRCFLGSFDFSWEQRKLSEITDKVTEKNAGLQYVETFTNSAEFGIISQRDFFDHDIAKLGSLDGYYIVKNEDFVYNPRISTSAPVGPINRNKLGRTGVMSPLYTVFRPHDIDTTYLEYFFKCGYWHSFMNFNGDSGARSDRFSIRDNVFFQMPIPIPDIDEQRKIGELLTCLDNLITLHQRKCANLCSPSQVVFSLLFATSTFSWEQRKFEEIAVRSSVICSDDTLPRVEYEDIVSGTGRLNKDIYAKQSIKSGIAFHQGDVLYGKLRPYLQNWLLPTFDGLAVGDFWVLQPQNADSSFLYRLIQSRQFDEVANQSTGTKMPRADWKLVSKTVFSIPSNISEQAAIGTYFTALDSLITLHQRECISFTGRADRLILTANKKRTTSSWEQRKVQGVADRFDNLRIPVAANLRVHGTTPYYGANGIQDYVEGFTHDGEFVLVAEDGANDLKNYPVKCVNGRIWVNNHAHVLQGKAGIADNSFLAFAISQSDIESLLVGGGRAKLNAETLMSIEFRLPCLQEQYRIGEYLTQLNHLITLHQRKPFLMKWRTSDANRNQTNRLVL